MGALDGPTRFIEDKSTIVFFVLIGLVIALLYVLYKANNLSIELAAKAITMRSRMGLGKGLVKRANDTVAGPTGWGRPGVRTDTMRARARARASDMDNDKVRQSCLDALGDDDYELNNILTTTTTTM